VHELLDQGLGLLECRRRLGWSLNTVKRYARAATAQELHRPRRYRATLVDPHRDHLRQRLIENPDVPVTHLLEEIRALGYPGSANLLVRYINQGRIDLETPPAKPRAVTSWIMTNPDNLQKDDTNRLDQTLSLCAHLKETADLVGRFAAMITRRDNGDLLAWMEDAATLDQPALSSFVNGLRLDQAAVTAALTLPYSNGPTEGTNTKFKFLKRQMYGRAAFPRLRQRILLN